VMAESPTLLINLPSRGYTLDERLRLGASVLSSSGEEFLHAVYSNRQGG
jgi:hypothetical protein